MEMKKSEGSAKRGFLSPLIGRFSINLEFSVPQPAGTGKRRKGWDGKVELEEEEEGTELNRTE